MLLMLLLLLMLLILTDHWSGTMETPSCIKKTVSACCRIKEERWRKLKEEYLSKTFERYFERGILTYLRYRSISRIIKNHCHGCSIVDPSQRNHYCITRPYLEWLEYKFEEMFHEIDFYIAYELTKIDESLYFFFPESYVSDVILCKRIKQKLISSYMEEKN